MADFRRGKRMDKTWNGIVASTLDFTSNTTSAPAGLVFSAKSTIIRMLGEYVIFPTAAPVALDECRIGVGIIVLSDDQFGSGTSGSLPDPISDFGLPWLFWAEHTIHLPTTSLDPASEVSQFRRTFDIRSMRKISNGQTLAWVGQYLDIQGTPPVTLTASVTRVLFAN